MKKADDAGRNFSALLRKLGKSGPPPPAQQDSVDVLIMSFLLWNCTSAKAKTAYRRIQQRVVDFNDLRVSMPGEIAEFFGGRYPQAQDRSQRIRAVLRHIYNREHAVSLQRLHSMGKREIKKYLRSLDGIVPFVADRVMLLCFGTRCIPVDENLYRALLEAGACQDTADLWELSSWLSRQIKASDAVQTHVALQTWVDRGGRQPRTRSSTPRGATTGSTKTSRRTAADREKSSRSR